MSKIFITKKDFKKYKICSKIALIFLNDLNLNTAKLLLKDKKISIIDKTIKLFSNKAKIDSSMIKGIKDYQGEAIEDGLEVEKLAKFYFMQKYPNQYIDLQGFNNKNFSKKIKNYLLDLKYNIFFESTFSFNGCKIRTDVLRRNNDGFDLIEIKGVSNLKKEHFYDVLFQYYVLTSLNLKIKNVYIMHMNSHFFLKNNKIKKNLDFLFIINNFLKNNGISLKQEIELYLLKNNLEFDIANIKRLLSINSFDIYKYLIKENCNNYSNDKYCSHVLKYIPEKNTIFNLYRLNRKNKVNLFYEENILNLKDVNLTHLANIKALSLTQKRQINVIQKVESELDQTKKDLLFKIFQNFKYPIYMYDYETMRSAIPKFLFSKTYQHIPFQYSVHILLNKNFNYHNNKNIKHFYYLGNGNEDPRYDLINNLVNHFFKYGVGVYVAWNKSFEMGIDLNLINLIKFDLLQPLSNQRLKNHKNLIKKIELIYKNTIDLMDFFKDFKIYKEDFNGSLSIKYTLPAFDPTFTYKHLLINKGDLASEAFRRRIENNISLTIWEKSIKNHLIYYCNQDTLAMVVLFRLTIDLLKKEKVILE